jgi:hypothetical protein
VIGLALIAAVLVIYFSYTKNLNFNPGEVFKPKPKPVVTAPLTGLPVDESLVNRRPLAVVIENSPDARPQSGYNDADVVYETLAEGGITRTLAIFQSQNSKEIGPVRSARPYFVDWLSELNAIFSHVGGDSNALTMINQFGISDLNQFFFGGYYWRSSARPAPHNVYTTTDRLYAAAKSAKYALTQDIKWYGFKKDAEEKDRPASQKVTVNFSGPLFQVVYNYDQKTNGYLRSVAGVPAKDKNTGIQIQPKNVIVQFEQMKPGTSTAGEQMVVMTDIGSGNALVFQDGKAIKARWSKTSRTSLTKITDESGNDIQLNPGQTWIEVVPVGQNVSY